MSERTTPSFRTPREISYAFAAGRGCIDFMWSRDMCKLLSVAALLAASTVTFWQPQPAAARARVVIVIQHRRHHHRYYWHGHYYDHRVYWHGRYYYR